VPDFTEALVKLNKGQTTDTPVKTEFGYHVIRVDDIRAAQLPAYEEVKPQIAQQMQQQKLAAFQNDLRKKAKVE
jgi:peptidyl-prolyl cis-trans isomerase C